MQSKQSEKYISLKHNGSHIDMDLETYVRWLSLLEGVELVSKKMKQFGNRLKNENLDWIKPLAFQKYIAERYESMKYEIEEMDKTAELNINGIQNTCTTLSEPVSV
jgi:hypothetical protein